MELDDNFEYFMYFFIALNEFTCIMKALRTMPGYSKN